MRASLHQLSCHHSNGNRWLSWRTAFLVSLSTVLASLAFAPNAVAGDLHDAVRANDPDRLVALLETGTAVDETDFMLGTALHVAVAQGSIPSARILLSHGADLEAPSEDRGARALHLAANFDDVEMVNFLLDAGADIEALDQKGQTPLLLAAATNSLEVVKVLIARGADKEARESEKGMTPLMRVSRLGFMEIAVVLVENGAEVNSVDSDGRSPLKLAATRNSYVSVGDEALIVYLAENGADLDLRDPDGYTALSWAMKDSSVDPFYGKIADVLRKLGASE